MMAVDTVYIAADTKTVPTSVDAAIAKLGYVPKRITTTASPFTSPGHLAVVDKGDSAALAAVKAQGWMTIVADGGHLSAADTATLAGTIHSNLAPDVVAFDDSAYTAAAAALPASLILTRQSGLTAEDFDASTAENLILRGLGTFAYQPVATVAVIPADSPADRLLADLSGVPVFTVDPAQGPCATLKAFLDQDSPLIGTVGVVDAGGKLTPDTVTQIGGLFSGPLGYATVNNPLVK
jgi:hypothetical protein